MLTPPLGNTYEFEIGDVKYRQNNIPPLAALGIFSKLASILKHIPALVKMRAEIAKASAEASSVTDAVKATDFSAAGVIGAAISELPDQHRDYIIESVLRVTFRQSGPGFIPAWNASANAPSAEIDMVTILFILAETYKAQFAPLMIALGLTLGASLGA